MYNQGNIRLHVDLFIKYLSNNGQFYIDITNNWQIKLLITLKSLYSLLFLVDYTLKQPFATYFRSDIDIIVFFVGRDENEWVGGII